MPRLFKLATFLGAALLAMSVVGGASAKAGDVTVTGNCSQNSTFKLKVSPPANGAIQTEFEVDQNVNRVTWSVKLSDNGAVFFDGTATTKPPSGEFRVRALAPDQAGPDTISATATNPATGETCSASATVS